MKNYLVVGASSGIGLEIVKQLSTNHHVYAMSRNGDAVESLSNVTYLQQDATRDIDTSQLPSSLDGLAYCPGTINLKPFHRLKLDDFQKEWELNFLGAVRTIQAVLPALKESKGAIVLFSTVAAKVGMPFHASIASCKAALEGLSRSIAAEYAPLIRSNVVAPSLTDTPLAERLLNNDQKRQASADRHPLKKVGTAEELAAMAVYLLGDDARFITGQTFGVDGGMGALKV